MKRKRKDILDPPTLDELRCLILHPEDTKGYNAEAVLLQQLYAFCLMHGFGRVFQMMEGIHDIWSDPNVLPEYQKLHNRHITHIRDGIRVFNSGDGSGHGNSA